MKVFLIGGPGNISTSSIEMLLASGHTVGLFTLPESIASATLDPRIKLFPGNRDDPMKLHTALTEFKPDVAIDYCCFMPSQAASIIPVICGKLAQFIFISSVDVYGFPLSRLPMRESDPWKPTNCEYAANKFDCEDLFKQADLPLTILRPAYSFGPAFVLTFNSRSEGRHMIARLRNHMPILVPGDGTTLIHVSSSYNTGRMIVNTVGNSKAIHNNYTIAHPTFMTHEDYVRLFARVLEVEPVIAHIPSDFILSLQTPETQDSLLNILTRFNIAFSIDKFRQDYPDFEWTMSLEKWAANYINLNDSKNNIPPASDEIFDDRLIKAWQKTLGSFQL
jgi:hypothetical protein